MEGGGVIFLYTQKTHLGTFWDDSKWRPAEVSMEWEKPLRVARAQPTPASTSPQKAVTVVYINIYIYIFYTKKLKIRHALMQILNCGLCTDHPFCPKLTDPFFFTHQMDLLTTRGRAPLILFQFAFYFILFY